jgi:hypothetical protein
MPNEPGVDVAARDLTDHYADYYGSPELAAWRELRARDKATSARPGSRTIDAGLASSSTEALNAISGSRLRSMLDRRPRLGS